MDDLIPRVHYIHRMSYSRQERRVGAFVLVALVAIVGLFLVNSRTVRFFEGSVTYHAYLRSAEGISNQTVVKVSGLEVGQVSNMAIAPDNRIHVSFDVKERYRDLIRLDSRATIGKLSVLGKPTIEISAGSKAVDVLPEEAFVPVDESMSVDQLMAEMTPVVRGVKETLDHVAEVVSAIDPQRINRSLHAIEMTAKNIRDITDQAAASKEVRGTMVALERTLREASARLAELQPILKEAQGISSDARRVTGELPALVNETTQLAAQLRSTATTFNMELQEFPDLVARMKVIMEQTERTMDGLLNTWPISSATPSPSPLVLEYQPIR